MASGRPASASIGPHLATAMAPIPSGNGCTITRHPPTTWPAAEKITGSSSTAGQRVLAKLMSCSWQMSSKAATRCSHSAAGTRTMVSSTPRRAACCSAWFSLESASFSAVSDIGVSSARTARGYADKVRNSLSSRIYGWKTGPGYRNLVNSPLPLDERDRRQRMSEQLVASFIDHLDSNIKNDQQADPGDPAVAAEQSGDQRGGDAHHHHG